MEPNSGNEKPKSVDTSSLEWRLECLARHRDRVAELKAAKTQKQRVALFTKYAEEVSLFSAREAWNAAFGDKAKKAKA